MAGEGSFFKVHKDTPRSETMFGSLVVVYPTPHEGGALTFREGDKSWTFDSAQAVSGHEGPCVAYAAFFSDIDHEVSVVNSGYRLTITYNLYFDTTRDIPLIPSPSPNSMTLKTELEQLLRVE